MVDFDENEIIDEHLIFIDGPDMDGLSLTGWNVVDIVDRGADNTGTNDVSALVQDQIAEQTALVFRPGTYHFDNTVTVDDIDDVALIAPNRAAITAGDVGENIFEVGHTTPPEGFTMKGFDFNLTKFRAGQFYVADRLYLKDIAVPTRKTETVDPAANTAIQCLSAGVTETDGIGVIEKLRLTGGGDVTGANDNTFEPQGLYVGEFNDGKMIVRDCVINEYPNNGFYASNSPGEVYVQGGVFKNNGAANVRVGSGPSGSVTVRDSNMVVDSDIPGTFPATRSIGCWNDSSILIEGCDIVQDTANDAAIRVLAACQQATIRNCRIEVNVSDYSIAIEAASGDQKGSTVVEGCWFEGSGDDSAIPYTIDCARSGTVFRDNHFESDTGSGRFGIHLASTATNCRIIGGTYATDVYNISTEAADTLIDNPVSLSVGFDRPIYNDKEGLRTFGVTPSQVTEPDAPHRTTYNGVGRNAGDPTSTGVWNGNGEEGLQVYDTTNDALYTYINGSWQS